MTPAELDLFLEDPAASTAETASRLQGAVYTVQGDELRENRAKPLKARIVSEKLRVAIVLQPVRSE